MVQILSALDENHITHYSTGQEDGCHSELDTVGRTFSRRHTKRICEAPKALSNAEEHNLVMDTAVVLSDIVILSFLTFAIPFIIMVYGGFLLFLHPPKEVLGASLLGGLVVGVVNLLVDVLAYYAHWWHYNLSNLVLHVPLPLYITPVLVYGSIVYLLIWRFWHGRGRWFSILLLIGVPVFCCVRDIYGALTQTSYTVWENIPLAIIVTIVMWFAGFYGGYFLFRRFAPERVSDTHSVRGRSTAPAAEEQTTK